MSCFAEVLRYAGRYGLVRGRKFYSGVFVVAQGCNGNGRVDRNHSPVDRDSSQQLIERKRDILPVVLPEKYVYARFPGVRVIPPVRAGRIR